jgi:hypothetical protein
MTLPYSGGQRQTCGETSEVLACGTAAVITMGWDFHIPDIGI